MLDYPAFDGDEPCRQVDPELFYPSSFNAVTKQTRALMDSLCNDCHMREPCLMWALNHESEGFWAGTTPPDREKIRRKLKIKLQLPVIASTERRKVA